MAEQKPMMLDDTVDETDGQSAKDNDGIPYCRKHHCRMQNSSGGKKGSRTKYYSCPVSGCEEKQQVIKTERPSVVPANPQECPRCSKKQPVYCERDQDASTAASVILKCPDCGWKSTAMVVPQLAAAHFANRRKVAIEHGVGDR